MSELKTTSLSHKDNNTGTPNITMFPDGTTSIGLTHTGGFKNQIINGNMAIAQRGPGPVVTASQAGTYATVDRFTVDDVTSEQVVINDLPGFSNALNIYSGGSYKVRQSVELTASGNNSQFGLGSTWTLSLWSSDDLTPGSLSLYFTDDHNGSNFQAVAENLSWVLIDTVSGSPNNWKRYAATFTVSTSPVSTNKCLNVEMTLVNGLSTGVQLEPGPVATPFEHRPIGTEISLCQRYYYRTADDVGSTNIMTMCNENNINASGSVPHPVLMRVPPVVTYGSGIYYFSGPTNATTFTSAGNRSSTTQLSIYIDVQSGITPGNAGTLYRASDINGFIEVDAEL